MGAARRCAGPATSWLTNPRLDRPETANWLAGRSPPSKADRASGVSPHEVAGYARTFKGRGPTLSDDDYRTRSPLRPGAGHRVGIQNPPAGRPPPQTADRSHVIWLGPTFGSDEPGLQLYSEKCRRLSPSVSASSSAGRDTMRTRVLSTRGRCSTSDSNLGEAAFHA